MCPHWQLHSRHSLCLLGTDVLLEWQREAAFTDLKCGSAATAVVSLRKVKQSLTIKISGQHRKRNLMLSSTSNKVAEPGLSVRSPGRVECKTVINIRSRLVPSMCQHVCTSLFMQHITSSVGSLRGTLLKWYINYVSVHLPASHLQFVLCVFVFMPSVKDLHVCLYVVKWIIGSGDSGGPKTWAPGF